jgi:hypothetical protein
VATLWLHISCAVTALGGCLETGTLLFFLLCCCCCRSLAKLVCSSTEGYKTKTAPPAITLTEAALKNLKRLREDMGDEKLLLRMGVKSGGCSGGFSCLGKIDSHVSACFHI